MHQRQNGGLLNKLLAEQTKSRPRQSNDDGLVESKNGAVIRKHIGSGHIASDRAEAITAFYRQRFNPYLNFHQPCGVPETATDRKRKTALVVSALCHALGDVAADSESGAYLKSGMTIDRLQAVAEVHSDSEAVQAMQAAKRKLFAGFPAKEDGIKTAAEMTCCARRGKPKAGFPPRSQPSEITARFPHSQSRDEQWKSGNAIPVFPVFHCHCYALSPHLKIKTRSREARKVQFAHSCRQNHYDFLRGEKAENRARYWRKPTSAVSFCS